MLAHIGREDVTYATETKRVQVKRDAEPADIRKIMSAKATLLEAIREYSREIRHTPGQNQLVEQLQELESQIDRAPDPGVGQGVPPLHGGTSSDTPSDRYASDDSAVKLEAIRRLVS